MPRAEQDDIMKLAVKSRPTVQKETKSRQIKVAKERQENMKQAHSRHEAMKKKVTLERDKLSKLHLITSCGELYQLLDEIDTSNSTISKKKTQKLSLLRTQVNIRKKVLGQVIHITFSHFKKQRPLNTKKYKSYQIIWREILLQDLNMSKIPVLWLVKTFVIYSRLMKGRQNGLLKLFWVMTTSQKPTKLSMMGKMTSVNLTLT